MLRDENMAPDEFSVRIIIEEPSGLPRVNEPVRLGVPFPRGLLFEPAALTVTSPSGETVAHQIKVLGKWSDRSIKWTLLDFQVSLRANAIGTWVLRGPESTVTMPTSTLRVRETEEEVAIDTGRVQFFFKKGGNALVSRIALDGKDMLDESGVAILLTDEFGQTFPGFIEGIRIQDAGSVRASVSISGGFRLKRKRLPINFEANISTYASSGLLDMDLGLQNPMAAVHPGNLWDLGDPGSFCFDDLTVALNPKSAVQDLLWQVEGESEMHHERSGPWSLYQDSSGGERWDSVNHVGADGQLTVKFRGYNIQAGVASDAISSGLRAFPVVAAKTAAGFLAVTIDKFWQNFPKALRWKEGRLDIALFPNESKAFHELQGGERKRHLIRFAFESSGETSRLPAMREPVHLTIDPEWIELTGALSNFVARAGERQQYIDYVQSVIEGPDSFFMKREVIDEYGWRNFGEVYADHEAVGKLDGEPLVSHYNNQYDFLHAACVHFLRSGDDRWRQLFGEAARHIVDIDIYNTDQDRLAYNGGLFWHSDHYKEAATATHRTYSSSNGSGQNSGGGPSNEHNYTSGLLLYYYLTGDGGAREAVLKLAEWVFHLDDGANSLFSFLDSSDTGKASCTVGPDFHRAGRGAGNSVNALLDAYDLTANHRYLAKAEQLICRCIHPGDDIADLGLDEPESRWSYLVFLQILGKYLGAKTELRQFDYFFYYARDSLLHYGQWVLENEVPYKQVLHKVELPTETWPAQDIRKCHVMHLAANYSMGERRKRFANKANYFFDHCLVDLLSFDTCRLARPRVILAAYGYIHGYYQKTGYLAGGIQGGATEHEYDFGSPAAFTPQRPLFQKLSWDRMHVFWRRFQRSARLVFMRNKKSSYKGQREL